MTELEADRPARAGSAKAFVLTEPDNEAANVPLRVARRERSDTVSGTTGTRTADVVRPAT